MLNTFFGLWQMNPIWPDTFIKDRVDWLTFNRLALKAARRNPALLVWLNWQVPGMIIGCWLGNYFSFSMPCLALWWAVGLGTFFARIKAWLEPGIPPCGCGCLLKVTLSPLEWDVHI